MKRLVAPLLITLLFLLVPMYAHAQDANTITVEPALVELELDGEPQASTLVTLTNQYETDITFAVDVRGIEEDSGRIIPGEELDPIVAAALKVSETQITIEPQSRYFLEVTASDSPDLPAGGHYASLVFTNISDGDDQSSSITTQLSIAVFLVKEQGKITKVEASKPLFEQDRFQFPTAARLGFLNDGNVHLVPRGYLRIYDTDYVYYETILNNDSQVVLPNRLFIQDLSINAQNTGLLPKRVTIELGYRADGMDETKIYTEQFWYIPRFLMLIAVIAVALITTGVGYLLFRRRRRKNHAT